jgi:hypothetical protein
MVALGAIVVVRVSRQRARLPLDDDPAAEAK